MIIELDLNKKCHALCVVLLKFAALLADDTWDLGNQYIIADIYSMKVF